MPGPGEYRPDPTEGTARIGDLPKAKVACQSRNYPELGRGRGKKAARRIDPDHLDWALSDFSGYIAADELYDGPFCILSIVDNRTFRGTWRASASCQISWWGRHRP